MPVKRRVVQATYISKEAKAALVEEAKRTDKFVSRVASEILEKGAGLLARKAARKDEDS